MGRVHDFHIFFCPLIYLPCAHLISMEYQRVERPDLYTFPSHEDLVVVYFRFRVQGQTIFLTSYTNHYYYICNYESSDTD